MKEYDFGGEKFAGRRVLACQIGCSSAQHLLLSVDTRSQRLENLSPPPSSPRPTVYPSVSVDETRSSATGSMYLPTLIRDFSSWNTGMQDGWLVSSGLVHGCVDKILDILYPSNLTLCPRIRAFLRHRASPSVTATPHRLPFEKRVEVASTSKQLEDCERQVFGTLTLPSMPSSRVRESSVCEHTFVPIFLLLT